MSFVWQFSASFYLFWYRGGFNNNAIVNKWYMQIELTVYTTYHKYCAVVRHLWFPQFKLSQTVDIAVCSCRWSQVIQEIWGPDQFKMKCGAEVDDLNKSLNRKPLLAFVPLISILSFFILPSYHPLFCQSKKFRKVIRSRYSKQRFIITKVQKQNRETDLIRLIAFVTLLKPKGSTLHFLFLYFGRLLHLFSDSGAPVQLSKVVCFFRKIHLWCTPFIHLHLHLYFSSSLF